MPRHAVAPPCDEPLASVNAAVCIITVSSEAGVSLYFAKVFDSADIALMSSGGSSLVLPLWKCKSSIWWVAKVFHKLEFFFTCHIKTTRTSLFNHYCKSHDDHAKLGKLVDKTARFADNEVLQNDGQRIWGAGMSIQNQMGHGRSKNWTCAVGSIRHFKP